jgi:sugar phosphate isomerase/epimerase
VVVERGMRLGAHTFLWTGHFAGHEEHVFAQAAACGYDGVEIALADPAVADPDRLGLWQQRYRLRVLLCATQPAGLSLAAPIPASVRPRSPTSRRPCAGRVRSGPTS